MSLIDLTPPILRASRLDALPVAIIGAGPVGLAAGAHLAERGIPFMIYEAGATVADSMSSWGHVRLFSPWEYLVDPAAGRLLAKNGWLRPAPKALPTGASLIEHYLEPLAAALGDRVRTGITVDAVSRQGMDRTRSTDRASTPFLLRLRGSDGVTIEETARAVIDASGTYRTGNSLVSSGLPPIGIADVADRISHALPDVLGAERARFAGRHTTVVGAGHSAANTLIALAELAADEPGTRITWLIRNASADRVTDSEDDELAARASLGSRVREHVASGVIEQIDRFEIIAIEPTAAGVVLIGSRNGSIDRVESDVVVNATGFRPDLDILREIRLDLDEVVEAPRRLAPLIDPNLHSCGTVEPHGFAELEQPEPNFFIAGMKSYGRAPTFLLATGYEQVRSIVAWLAGDVVAARNVELVLPATGVCSTDANASCCAR